METLLQPTRPLPLRMENLKTALPQKLCYNHFCSTLMISGELEKDSFVCENVGMGTCNIPHIVAAEPAYLFGAFSAAPSIYHGTDHSQGSQAK